MGQAQRSDRRNIPQGGVEERRTQASADRRRQQRNTRNRTGNSHRSSSGNNISVIYGNDSRSRGKEGAKRRRTDNDHLQGLELWEISREDKNGRLMRLADHEQIRSGKNRADSVRRIPNRPRSANAARRRKAKRQKELLCRCFMLLVITVCLVLIYQTAGAIYHMVHDKKIGVDTDHNKGIVNVMSEKLGENKIEPPEILEDFLEVNDYSRPGTKLTKVKSIFVHYTANPGTSAQQNRSYFANLAETHERSASAHFIIGYDGEIVQCIPLEEQAYAVATRNEDSVSIECCYQDDEGKFTQETYDSLVHMLAWLTQEYHLSTDDILRHYDCGGKMCPIYYVENEDAWEQLLADVDKYEPESTAAEE